MEIYTWCSGSEGNQIFLFLWAAISALLSAPESVQSNVINKNRTEDGGPDSKCV